MKSRAFQALLFFAVLKNASNPPGGQAPRGFVIQGNLFSYRRNGRLKFALINPVGFTDFTL